MSTTGLLIERENGLLRITLNRPEARNALTRTMIAALTETLLTADADESVRCVALGGTPPAFCAGLDLKEVAASTPEQAEQDADALVRLFETLDGLGKPVIAAIEGPAVAGGAGLASVCDVVICTPTAKIGYPEVKRGLIAAVVMTYLRRLVGERRAKQLLLTGDPIGADQAVEFGLATECVSGESLWPRVREYADAFTRTPPGALAATKALWTRIRPMAHADALRAARELNAAMRTSGESRAAIGEFFSRQ